MHNAVLVRVRERAGDIAQQAHDVDERKLTLAREPSPERLAVDERHCIVGKPVDFPGRQQRHDVRMLQPRRQRDLPPKALDGHGVRELGRQHLHHDAAVERRLGREKDARHATAAELALDGVVGAERCLELVP